MKSFSLKSEMLIEVETKKTDHESSKGVMIVTFYSFGKRFANNVIEMSDHLFSFQKSLHICWFTFFCDRWRRSDGESQPILNFEPNTLCKI